MAARCRVKANEEEEIVTRKRRRRGEDGTVGGNRVYISKIGETDVCGPAWVIRLLPSAATKQFPFSVATEGTRWTADPAWPACCRVKANEEEEIVTRKRRDRGGNWVYIIKIGENEVCGPVWDIRLLPSAATKKFPFLVATEGRRRTADPAWPACRWVKAGEEKEFVTRRRPRCGEESAPSKSGGRSVRSSAFTRSGSSWIRCHFIPESVRVLRTRHLKRGLQTGAELRCARLSRRPSCRNLAKKSFSWNGSLRAHGSRASDAVKTCESR